MHVFSWLLRAAIFCVLFAFALNNQHDVQLHGFFGYGWHAPMVFVVLAAFGLGCAVTLLALMPGWWRLRRKARDAAERVAAEVSSRGSARQSAAPAAETPLPMPPRDGR